LHGRSSDPSGDALHVLPESIIFVFFVFFVSFVVKAFDVLLTVVEPPNRPERTPASHP
jgi:hypothetical protein